MRIIDANLNRLSEGLRLLEDVARFVLDDTTLSTRLRSLRHNLLPTEASLGRELLSARDVAGDVGAFGRVEAGTEGQRDDLASLVVANARRAEQSLRVLEEWGQLPEGRLDWKRYQEARFALYEVEQALVSRLLRRDRAAQVRGLYVIVDVASLSGRSEIEVARQAIAGGARVLQLRDKEREKGELARVAADLQRLCTGSGVLFLVNDHVDVALAVAADGVHLGQKDLPVATVRRMLPIDKVVGCSTANVEEAVRAQQDGADYVAVGSIYSSPSKERTRPAGPKVLRQARESLSIPLVAIGGINQENVGPAIEAGANAVAVISAVLGARDVEAAARGLAERVEELLSRRQG